MRAVGLFVATLSCRSADPKVVVDGLDTAVLIDSDLDGYLSDEDCDDQNASIHPGASETCDGLDNNCNDEVDEGVEEIFYWDNDGDGFGQNEQFVYACEAPDGYVPTGNDCDDSSADVYPSAPEQCDDIDNNCNEVIDEDLIERWYYDEDEDGYGQNDNWIDSCLQPDGFVDNPDDCDDENPDTFPFADEICDYQDNDCDDEVDEGVLTAVYTDADGDGYGDEFAWIEVCEWGENQSLVGGDCDDIDPLINPGATEYCNTIKTKVN